ncbi:MAG: hypothetical protein AAF707_08555 [Pseudomonadota bacterium]
MRDGLVLHQRCLTALNAAWEHRACSIAAARHGMGGHAHTRTVRNPPRGADLSALQALFRKRDIRATVGGASTADAYPSPRM